MEKVKFDKELSENEEVNTVLCLELEGTMFNEGTMKKDYEDDNFKIGGDDDKENVGDDNRQVETLIFPDDREEVRGDDHVETDVLPDDVGKVKKLEKDELGKYWMKKNRFRNDHNIEVWENGERVMNWSAYWMKENRFKNNQSQQNKVVWENREIVMKNVEMDVDEFDQYKNFDQTKTGGEY